ncbi:nucleolar protein dnt1-like [Chenopodium quinoa]|uniref:nucleolar protein dnt1-like n=1 Tax=Chenopodium quinoa TaxID=63459 RepID=UPI000B78EA5B|nr:nucleolar protein dnt1-like [Chenopodium quinoa]
MIMDLNEVPTLVSDQKSNGVKIEEKNVENFDGVVDKESEESRIKSIEQEQRFREVEEKQLALELEIRNKVMNLEEIKVKIRVLEGEKLRIEEEIKGLKVRKAGLVGANVGGEFLSDERVMEDEDVSRVSQLMVENKVLACEKNFALKEVEVCKRKCEDLELRMLELEGRLKSHGKADISIGINGANPVVDDDVCASSPSRDLGSPSRLLGAIEEVTPIEGSLDKKYVRTNSTSTKQMHVKRRLAFYNEKSCVEKIAPSTPATVIDIIDCDNDDDVLARLKPNSQSEGLLGLMSKNGVQETDGIMTPNTKRKRDLMVVTSDDECDNYKCTPNKRSLKIENSDSEGEDKDDGIKLTKQSESDNDDDDNIPISQLKRNRAQGSQPALSALPLDPTRPKRRLVKYGQGELRDKTQNTENHPDTLISENVADHESSEDESEGSDHLSSFIVDDSDDEDVEDDISKEDTGANFDDVEDDVSEEGGDDSDDDGDSSDSNLNYDEIISKLRGRRKPNSKWISEADMLSDFGKNPELCMKAVCAIYRQQTNEEKACKASIVSNGRGFSKFDATRGTYLGEFLTDGVPNGDLVKSVEELQKYHPSGVEECRSLADRYSKQLFNIYENGEDPYFP